VPVPPSLTRFLRFAALSGLGWIGDTAITLGLHARGVPLFQAALVGGCTAAAGVFLASRQTLFRATGGSAPGLLAYLGYSAGMIILAGAALAQLNGIILNLWTIPPTLAALSAKVVITPPLLAMNFTMARTLSSLFAEKPPKPRAT
jgi:hypothetical protein